MIELARVEIAGDPVPQGSLTAFINPRMAQGIVIALQSRKMPVAAFMKAIQRCVVMPQKPKVKAWRDAICLVATADQLKRHHPVMVESGPIRIEALFVLRRPKSTRKTNPPSTMALAAKRPDIDKLVRAVLDALTGVWFKDDAQVVDLIVAKRVAEPGISPGLTVTMFGHDGCVQPAGTVF
jgi:crossover junction endodeoxyribonuclease RusA